MLQTIREKLTGWFAIFILGAIALTLVVTFGNIDTGFSGGSIAAKVNGEEIPMQEFQQLYQRQRQQWEANFREQLPEDLANAMADSVIQSLISNRLIVDYVRDSGYRVNDSEVIAAIQSMQSFQVGGEFSRLAYEQALAAAGFSSQRFEFEQRQDMQVQQFQRGIQASAFFTPDQFRRYIELDGETRAVRYAILPSAVWRERVELAPGAVEAYYNENQSMFRTEESVDIEYLEVDYNEILAETEITDAEAQAYFAENKAEFAGPDDRQVSHILIPVGDDETAALVKVVELRDRILDGADFAALARENSADTLSAARGGDLGWLGNEELPAAEFEPALAALDIGEVSEPVRTQFGYHLIKLTDTRASAKVNFADVREELMARLKDDRAVYAYGQLVDELDELALESIEGLKPVAEVMGLELQTQAGVSRSGGGELGQSPQLLDAIFSLEVLEDGENTPVIELDDGRAVVAHVAAFNPSVVRPLDDVREQITALLESNESMLLAAAAGNELVSRLKDGAEPASIAAENGFEWNAVPALRRGSGQLPPDLIEAAFKASRPRGSESGKAYQGLLLASGDYAIYQVTDVVPGSPELFDVEARDQRKQMLANQLGFSQLNALVTSLTESADTSVTPDLLGNETDLL